MFAYCGNNPIISCDPTGTWSVPNSIVNANAMNRLGGSSIYPISDRDRVQQEGKRANRCGTLIIGASFSKIHGAGESVTVGVVADTYWNVGLIITPAVGGGFPSAGAVGVVGITNAPTIYDLSGWSGQAGGSINVGGFSAGAETSFFANSQNGQPYQGLSFMLGAKASLPVELHGTIGYSYVHGKNLFDILIDATNVIFYS